MCPMVTPDLGNRNTIAVLDVSWKARPANPIAGLVLDLFSFGVLDEAGIHRHLNANSRRHGLRIWAFQACRKEVKRKCRVALEATVLVIHEENLPERGLIPVLQTDILETK